MPINCITLPCLPFISDFFGLNLYHNNVSSHHAFVSCTAARRRLGCTTTIRRILASPQTQRHLPHCRSNGHRDMDQFGGTNMQIHWCGGQQLWRECVRGRVSVLSFLYRSSIPRQSLVVANNTFSYACNGRCGTACDGVALGNVYTQDCYTHDICSYFELSTDGAR